VAAELPKARVALITGASRGIGAHLAAAFAAAGHTVAASSRTGRGAGVSAVDVTDESQVSAYVAAVMARHGRIDVLVNNAGLIDDEVPLWDSDPAQWRRVLEVNVVGPYLMARAVIPHMIAAGAGRVVNLNSGAGTRAAATTTSYHASKTALARLTGGIHLAGWEHGIRAFDLAPGVVRTDMTTSMPAHRTRREWTDPAAVGELAVALAEGRLDAWSGRLVRAGLDTVDSLRSRAGQGLADTARTVGLIGWGAGDPLG
jgi:NAD(P)-dependent dehydrogenase (short-subunit alcohol dehydrogenase family)